jgi:hypothetical protein
MLSGAIVEGFATRELAPGWQILGGVRYYSLDAEADISVSGVPQSELDGDKAWVDPIIGGRFEHSFSERWSVHVRADVGGFGLGSDFAWNASILGAYALSKHFRAFLGYRALDFDFADGSAADRVEYDVRLWGPLIGVSFDF